MKSLSVIVSKKASQHNLKNVGRPIRCGSACGFLFIHVVLKALVW